MHAGRRAHVGHQHMAQVERSQVALVEVVGQPVFAAQHLVGSRHPVDGPVEEGADGVVVLAVGGFAGQVRAMDRGVDDQPRPLVGGVAQHQGQVARVEALAQRVQQAGPGGWLHRAAVGQPQQLAELRSADAREFMGKSKVVHPRLSCSGCGAGWEEYWRDGPRANRPFGLGHARFRGGGGNRIGCAARTGTPARDSRCARRTRHGPKWRRQSARSRSTIRSAAASADSLPVSTWISGACGGS
ncbi:hypothetical protein D9M68_443630 [compost metagenome]